MCLVDDAVVERLLVVGTPDECQRSAQRYLQAGASSIILVPTSDNYEEIVEVFAPGR